MPAPIPAEMLTDENITAIAEAIAREMRSKFSQPGDAIAALGTALRMTAHMAGISDERLLASLSRAWREAPIATVQ